MAIDTSIYGNIQQPQPANQLASLAQAYQIRGLQAGIDKADRDEQRQNRLLQLVSAPEFQKLDPQGKANALQGVGDFENAGKVITSAAAANKDTRAAEGDALKNTTTKFDLIGQVLGGVRDQDSYTRGIQQLNAMGIPTPNAPAQYDPAIVQQFGQQAIAAKDKALLAQQQATATETNRHNVATEGNQAGTLAVGQGNLANAQARLAWDQQNGKAPPSGYERDPDKPGALRPIAGGPADPNTPKGKNTLNDTQAKALQFGTRMQASEDILSGLADQGIERPGLIKRVAEATPLVGAGAGALTNWTQSSGQQQVEQAQRDFINAALRRESGAAISEGEFVNAKQQYFPQPGDSDAVKAQKKANRELATRGILAEVPDSDQRVAQVRGTPASAKPAAAAPAAGGLVSVTDAASYAKVPKGAQYTTPDGKVRVKQ